MQWVKDWRSIFSNDIPYGEDISFHPEFEQLQEEIEKSVSIYAEDQTDWTLVFTYANNILSNTAKDLWVFCYGARAAYTEGGVPWLLEAVNVLNEYLESHWEHIHPIRPRRRLAALQWFCSRMEQVFIEASFSTDDIDCRSLHESFIYLQELLEKHFKESSPSIRKVIKTLSGTTEVNSIKNSAIIEKDEPVLPSPSPIQQATPSDTPPIVTNSSDTLSNDILTQVNRNTADQTKRLAAHYLSLNIFDWRGYLLNRVALWSTISQLPSADRNNVTAMRPIPKDKLNGYQSAIQTKQFATLLPALERSAANQPYWLDGHFMVFKCLEALKAKDAQETVLFTLKKFLQNFPELKKFKFFDTTPFASSETLQWIESLEQESFNENSFTSFLPSSSSNTIHSENISEEALLKNAIEKGSHENFEAGLSLLGSTISLRSRIATKNAILKAQYCLAMKKKNAAKEILKAAYQQLDQWNLLDWEPELSAQIIYLLTTLQKGKNEKSNDEMLHRLYSLHLETALKINPE